MTYIEDKLLLATKKWKLTDLNAIYKQSNRAVFSAKSACYGDVILKLNSVTKELSSEYGMLERMKGVCCCKVYEYDSENGMFLEEKILPGMKLRDETDVNLRIMNFVTVFQKIHREVTTRSTFDTYMDWLERTCRTLQYIPNEAMLGQKMMLAREIGQELFGKYTDRVLLHGDLHHDNMLLTQTGDYVIIDPKGVIGPAIFDIPRYLLNEIDAKVNETKKEHIQYVISRISDYLGYPVEDIQKLFFMEVVLGNSWCVESGEEPNLLHIQLAVEILQD